jgi:oligopeptide transport system substrate-binding protein
VDLSELQFRRAVTRRAFLGASVVGAAGLLAACGGSTEKSATSTSAPAANTPAAEKPTAAATAPAGQATAPAPEPTATAAAPKATGGIFRYGAVEPEDADPGITGSPWSLSELFEGLVVISPKDGTASPAMAESYEANADGTVWTYKVRPGMQWSDGTPLNANDFLYAWRRVMDPATASKYTSVFYPIKNGEEVAKGDMPTDQLGVKAVDDLTFEVTLSDPTPFFPIISATWTAYPVPQHVIEKAGNKWLEPGTLVVNGPFILSEWKHDQLMVFEPNKNYWGDKPSIDKAEYTIYDDWVAKGLTAFENDEVDHALVPAAEYDRVRADATLSAQMQPYPTSSTEMIHFDTSNKPTDDVRVRQALALGFDRDSLITKVLKDYYLPAPTILPADIPSNNPGAALAGDIAKAKELLSEAGFPDGKGWPTDFTLVSRTTSPLPLITQYLQQQWKQNLGIDVQLQPLEPRAYVEWRSARKTQPYNAHLGIWGSDFADPSNWHNQLFASNADFYKTHWKNDEYDKLVEAALIETDEKKRMQMYSDAEVILVREAANVGVYHGQNFYVTKPNVHNIYHLPTAAAGSWLKLITIEKS